MGIVRKVSKLARDKRGNVLAITAAALPLLVGTMGLGVDFAQWVMWKRTLQGAADAAALAGATARQAGLNDTQVTAEATKVLNANAVVTRSSTAVNFELSPDQTSGATPTTVEVIAEAQGRLYFARLFTSGQPTIRARAKAGPRGPGTACFLSLGKSGAMSEWAMKLEDATITANGCGFHSNSTGTEAAQRWGNGSFTGDYISAVGDVDISGTFSAQEKDNQSALTDPYGAGGRNLQIPAHSGTVARCPGKVCPTVSGAETISPPSGADANKCISNNDGSKFTIERDTVFAPGVYIFCGGHDTILNIADGAVTGDGVSIILKGGMRLEVNGNVDLDLRAMSTTQANNLYGASGSILNDANRKALAGMLFWQTVASSPSDKPNFITGNAGASLRGAFYAPHSQFELSGNLGAQGCMQLVAQKIYVKGNATLGLANNCAALTGNDTAFTHFGASTNIVLVD